MNRYTPTLIFLFLCLIFVFANMACTNIRIDRSNQKGFPNKKRQLKKGRPIVRVPTKITSYPLRDSKGKIAHDHVHLRENDHVIVFLTDKSVIKQVKETFSPL